MANQMTRGSALVGNLGVGGGRRIDKIDVGTAAIDPPSIAIGAQGIVTFTLPGAAPGDVVVLNPPASLHADLIFGGAWVSAADTVSLYLYNEGAAAVDDTSRTWTWLWVELA